MRRKIAKRIRKDIILNGGIILEAKVATGDGKLKQNRYVIEKGYSVTMKYRFYTVYCVGKDELDAYKLALDEIKCIDTKYNLKDLQSNLEKLQVISELKYNWDFEGAMPISEDTITNMKFILNNVHRQPEIFPVCDGSIQIEYENNKFDYLEFQVTGNIVKVFIAFITDDACESMYETLISHIDIDYINSIIDIFFGQEHQKIYSLKQNNK